MTTIRIEVEVPDNLEVVRESPTLHWIKVPSDGRYAKCMYDPTDPHWVHDVGRQIAAAVEARKPRPPKFAVGDVVEWLEDGEQRAGVVSGVSSHDFNPLYRLNGHKSWAKPEIDLSLVRRAAK